MAQIKPEGWTELNDGSRVKSIHEWIHRIANDKDFEHAREELARALMTTHALTALKNQLDELEAWVRKTGGGGGRGGGGGGGGGPTSVIIAQPPDRDTGGPYGPDTGWTALDEGDGGTSDPRKRIPERRIPDDEAGNEIRRRIEQTKRELDRVRGERSLSKSTL